MLPPTPEPLADAGAVRHRLINAFAELLGLLGIEILVLEDVHWDEVTLELLLALAFAAASAGQPGADVPP
ncbi:hypothetical protein ACFC09_36945 [Streptomyces sp. NPDC056161]|uniref:hypothetical protein n=1 Tax=Streptomyces sp. NPDC056161 TaxID=3345732 RepID=UPI0035E39F5A